MTLAELSKDYEAAAQLLRDRLRLLRKLQKQATEPEELFRIKRRINELAELTARYYERGYYRNEKYTL